VSPDTDEWLATMRSARKAGVERDEREEGAAARRLARTVAPPEAERPGRQSLGELLVLAACIVACAVVGMQLRHTGVAPRSGAIHEILADRAHQIAPVTIATAEPAPAVAPAIAGTSPTASARPAPVPPVRAKRETEALPPLPPPPPPSNDRAADDRTKMRMKHFELKIDRSWRTRPPSVPGRQRLPPGHVHNL
jgi:hypothetical protein